MPLNARYLFTANMDVDAAKEALFNEVYDTEHIPALTKVSGVVSVSRYRMRELTMFVAGERRTIVLPDEPRYTAVYELESPSVLTSAAWGKATEEGRWPGQVRPYTKNRRHVLRELVYTTG